MDSKKLMTIMSSVILVVVFAIILILWGLNNKSYDVTFNSDGGTSVETQTIKKNKTAKKPTNPTKEGYIFDAWYYDDAIFDFDTKITEDITLTAKWIEHSETDKDEQNFIVRFDTKGGNTLTSIVVKEGMLLDKPANPTKDGYEFVSWQLNGVDFDFTKEITSDITLIATWKEVKKPENNKPVTPTPKPTVNVSGVSISKSSLNLKVGESDTLTATVKPNNATNKTVTWSSSNNNVATVTNGKVVAVGKGTATITVTASGKTATCTVTVTEEVKVDPTVDVNSVSISKSSLNLKIGESDTLTATINPDNATDKTMTWSSSNNSVATVTNGKVVAVGKGTATITVTASGKTATCTVTVTEEVTYSIDWVKIESSTLDEYMLYIKSSNNEYVAGQVEITTLKGTTKIEQIPVSGKKYVKAAIANVTIK